MFNKRGRSARTECEHRQSVTVSTAGITRTVCEVCGMVSIHAAEGLSGEIERSQFERDSERVATALH